MHVGMTPFQEGRFGARFSLALAHLGVFPTDRHVLLGQ
ncbi:hypothetical protein TR2A62_1734 [Thalassobium sp. R2A62]|jgi:hypothetical protein|nr:hypothetical protein TR2A62_1734 [Thalassobium sp. R2A62]